MITAEESYETSEPTIDNHIVKLKATGADVFISITHAEIRGAGDQGNLLKSSGSRCISSPTSQPPSAA